MKSLYKECKNKNGLDICTYNHGIVTAIDEMAGFLQSYRPRKYKDLIKESALCWNKYQGHENDFNLENTAELANDLENAIYAIKVKGFYLVQNNADLFYVDSVTYNAEFREY
jgi:hypothetical protein